MVSLRRLSEGDEDCHTKSQSTEKHHKPKKISFCPASSFLPLRLCVSSRATATSMRAWWVCEDCRREMKIVTQKVKVQRSMTKPKKISHIHTFMDFVLLLLLLLFPPLRLCV